MKFNRFYILCFLILPQFLLAQINFESVVSKNTLGVNQRLRIEFKVNKQGADDFIPPSFKNFTVVAGPSTSVNQSWINGRATYSQSYIYFLEPKDEGEFTIEPATITYEGKKIQSNEVKITVTKAVEIPKDPNNPYYIAQQNIHLVAEVSKLNPYVGEGIYVVYKLYVSNNISVHDYRITESPEYNGFWNQDFEVKDNGVKTGKYNGEDYRYLVLKRAVLIPQRSGKLQIEPIKMSFSLGIPTGRGDFFGNMITKNINFSTQSEAKDVTVKALPEANKPLDFSGAVGEFNFTVASTKTNVKANEAAQIEVSVTGKGNLKLFEIPKISTPPELEVYTPEYKEQIATSLSGLRGTVSETYTVVPQNNGKYKIPEVSFSYFDTKENSYKTITTEPIIMSVTGDERSVTSTSTDSSYTQKQEVVANQGNAFRFIALDTTLVSKQQHYFFTSTLFYSLLALPLLMIPVIIVIGEKRAERARDVFGNKIRKADKLARKYLSEAKKQLGNHEAFYIALEKALHNFLKAKLYVETSDISKEKISSILQDKKVDTDTVKAFIDVLNDCDFARYTPSTNVMMEQEYEKAKQVLTQLDKQL